MRWVGWVFQLWRPPPRWSNFPSPLTIWGLSNALTSAFKEREPIPHFEATAKLAEFLEVLVLTVVLAIRFAGWLIVSPTIANCPVDLHRFGWSGVPSHLTT